MQIMLLPSKTKEKTPGDPMGHYCATVRWKLSSTIVNGFRP
jgi:hypothetical protein